MNTLTLYPLSNYSFETKEPQPEEDPSVNARLQRLESDYHEHGMRRTVEGLLVVHEHGHPHVLLLQVANAFFKLPGDYLKPDESDLEGLQTRLHYRLGPASAEEGGESHKMLAEEKRGPGDWEISDLLAQWWRPNFESFMYPYIPAHISQPKEVKSMYLVQMPERQVLTVPRNMKLIALPLFELYDNSVRYGPSLAAIPHLLSKYNFIMS
ncbi:Cleavage/polyadenylation specificity factor subunit 5 [Leucosporidium creatinivorum]|uniref:Cleavage and polyadenylation specificity factor subunit 5 n=1 Tax=Leucosporidium creatinivorum TaxID=106004 RepID=A0A1Y2EVL7_9BASI|nr:Cleavage/polyadenylation specificity factor subunit 5 [Leucosporidium creatinivorum]